MADRRSSKRPREESPDEAEVVRIRIKAQDGTYTTFQANITTRIIRVFKLYCKEKNLVYGATRFLIQGNHVSSYKTIEQLRLRDGSVIDAMIEQTGGGGDLFLASRRTNT